MKYLKLGIVAFSAAILSGCYEEGDCVLVSVNSFDEQIPVVAEYIDYDDGAHWYRVNGEIRSMHGLVSSVTSCSN